MMRCPCCLQGELESDGFGWKCEFCGEYFTIEELIIYDQEENNKTQKPDADAESD